MVQSVSSQNLQAVIVPKSIMMAYMMRDELEFLHEGHA